MTIEYKIKIENGALTVTQRVELDTSGADAAVPASVPEETGDETLPNTLAQVSAGSHQIKPAGGGDDEPRLPPPPGGDDEPRLPPPPGGGLGDGAQVLVFGPVIFDLCGLIKRQSSETSSSEKAADET